jgi:FRG domain
MDGVRVHSWSELLQQTAADDVSFNARLQRFRSPFAFRGISADWPLTTSIQRLKHDVPTLRHIEKAMFRNFKKYAYADFDPTSSDWKWLALAQHHGLPTRLLDWTFSPFVAMHFATNELDKMDKDGVLWMVNFEHSRKHLPPSFTRALERHFALTFSVEMLEEDRDLSDPFVFDDTEGAQNPFVIFFEPPSLDPRIVNQWGLFSLMNRLDLRLDEWLALVAKSDTRLARKIVIDAEAKWEIRDRLDGMNLTERVLMPGLDGLSTWLKRWYSPKSAHPIEASEGPQRASVEPAQSSNAVGNVVVIPADATPAAAAARKGNGSARRAGNKPGKAAAVIANKANRSARGREAATGRRTSR